MTPSAEITDKDYHAKVSQIERTHDETGLRALEAKTFLHGGDDAAKVPADHQGLGKGHAAEPQQEALRI